MKKLALFIVSLLIPLSMFAGHLHPADGGHQTSTKPLYWSSVGMWYNYRNTHAGAGFTGVRIYSASPLQRSYGAERYSDVLYQIYLRPGIRMSRIAIKNMQGEVQHLSGSPTFSFGVLAEYIFPFSNAKWSLFTEPTFQYFSARNDTYKVHYKSLEIPVGARYFMYPGDDSNKIYSDFSLVMDIPFSSRIDYGRNNSLETFFAMNFRIGLGYEFENKWNVGLTYQWGRNIISRQGLWGSSYSNISLVAGYGLL